MSVTWRENRKKWLVSKTVNGKRIRLLCESKAEAKRIDTDLRLKNCGLFGISQSYSIAEAFASYIETESQQKSTAARKADKRLLDQARTFFADLGADLMANVTLEYLQRFQIHCSDICHWSDTTVAHRMKILRSVFNKAFRTDRIPKNPAEYWKVPAGSSAPRRPMTRDEFSKLIQIDNSGWLTPVLLFIRLTGARGASVAALKWSDIDFSTGSILMRSRKGGLKKTKTIAFPMYPELFNLMARIQRSNEFVFLDEDLQPLSAHRISSAGHRLIKKAGLKGVVMYGLRHALATDLIEAGVSTEITRKAMGHSNVNQLQVYTRNVVLDAVGKSLTLIRGDKK